FNSAGEREIGRITSEDELAIEDPIFTVLNTVLVLDLERLTPHELLNCWRALRDSNSDPQIRSLSVWADIVVLTVGLEPPAPYAEQIFVPLRLSPPPLGRSWSGLSLRRGLRRRRRPSSLYTFPFKGLGSGLA